MAEPVFGGRRGEKAGAFEEQFEIVEETPLDGPESPVDGLEAETGTPDPPEASEPSEEAPEAAEGQEEESDAQRLVREAAEAMKAQAAPPAPPAAVPVAELAEIKQQIMELAKAREADGGSKKGFDEAILDDPQVAAHLRAARESDDPVAEAKALATIAKHVIESERGDTDEVAALRQELEALKQSRQQEVQRQLNQQMFVQGLRQAEAAGDVEQALVHQFLEAREFERWNAHLATHKDLSGYVPQSALGKLLMEKPHYAATPELMEDGVRRLANGLRGKTVNAPPQGISTTGASAPAAGSKAGAKLGTQGSMKEEDAILASILKAADRRKSRAKAFM